MTRGNVKIVRPGGEVVEIKPASNASQEAGAAPEMARAENAPPGIFRPMRNLPWRRAPVPRLRRAK